jgi:hypothetical protein
VTKIVIMSERGLSPRSNSFADTEKHPWMSQASVTINEHYTSEHIFHWGYITNSWAQHARHRQRIGKNWQTLTEMPFREHLEV